MSLASRTALAGDKGRTDKSSPPMLLLVHSTILMSLEFGLLLMMSEGGS